MARSPNRLLDSLPKDVFAALQPHLKVINLKFGEVVAEVEQLVSTVYFPHSGVISLVVEMDAGDLIEAAMVGRDGVVNASSALDGKMSLHKGFVQADGAASVIDADALRRLADESAPFRSIAQAQQSAGCNASHSVEARMCRWLLRIRDLTQSDDMKITQEFFGQMLGVRRTSVSIVAGTLQQAGWLKVRRGTIQITDVEGVRSGACECYEKVRSYYERLLVP